MSMDSSLPAFVPPRWLRNPHLQSVLPSLSVARWPVLWRARQLREVAQPEIITVEDGVRLLAVLSRHAGDAPRPWAIVLHGWLGNADSSYVLSLSARLFAAGYHICRLNLRDHGGTEHLNAGLFHSCLLDEVVAAVAQLQRRHAMQSLSLAGFSLGGNFALRVAAHAARAGIVLHKVVAICPALNPHGSDQALAQGPIVYRQHFLTKWKQSLRRKQRHFPGHYDFAAVRHVHSITELTDRLVSRHAGFSNAPEYYEGYSLLGDTLSAVTVPCHLLLAEDDPIVPVADVRRLAPNPHLHLTITPHGGHCGFIGVRLQQGKRWSDEWALRCLQDE